MMTYAVEKNDLMELLEEAVKLAVHETVRELRKGGFLRAQDELAYQSAAAEIKRYYEAIKNHAPYHSRVKEAVESIQGDEYANIIRLYYCDGYTISDIAAVYGCEPSTITRNKKRLCIEIYKRI